MERTKNERRRNNRINKKYKNKRKIVRSNNEESREFTTKVKMKQGCILSLVFSLVMDEVIKKVKTKKKAFNIEKQKMKKIQNTELIFIDDMTIVRETEEDNTTWRYWTSN